MCSKYINSILFLDLENLNPASELFQTLGMKLRVQSFLSNPSRIQGIVTLSCIEADAEMMKDSIMDSCIVNVPIICEQQTIVSHCLIDDPVINVIPSGWMFHTAAVKQENSVLYVTIAFRVDDDLKGTIEQSHGWKGTSLASTTSTQWQAKLFEAHETMSQSFTATWRSVTNLLEHAESKEMRKLQRFSMEDIVQKKDIPAMMQHRVNVSRKINFHVNLKFR